MKINDNNEIIAEVRFGDLKPGDTFAIDRGSGYAYFIKAESMSGCQCQSVDLTDGSMVWFAERELVIPVEIVGEVKWPAKFIKRK